MGGNMSWPRFRGRNGLNIRPNYFSSSDEAPDPSTGIPPSSYSSLPGLDDYKTMLSGEIDRMVYGWWQSTEFLEAAAEKAGLKVEQVLAVIRAMLTWDTIDSHLYPPHWGEETIMEVVAPTLEGMADQLERRVPLYWSSDLMKHAEAAVQRMDARKAYEASLSPEEFAEYQEKWIAEAAAEMVEWGIAYDSQFRMSPND